jgi:ferrous iron transport protein B
LVILKPVSLATESKTITVALLGNPNTGKSTLFTALCGVRQRTGNYPGVTVEKKTGRYGYGGRRYELIDLPGTYSLAPRSPDEMVAVDVLLGRQTSAPRPDVVLCIVDAGNLERNLYLVSQILELGLPVVVALNMVDAARSKGVTINAAQLADQLNLPVVPIQANKSIGIDSLRQAIDKVGQQGAAPPTASPLPDVFNREVELLRQRDPQLPRYLAERLILDTSGYLATARLPGVTPELLGELPQVRARLAKAKCSVPSVEALARYQWIAGVLEGVVSRKPMPVSLADRVDRVLTHRVWGSLAFVAVMVVMFGSVFWLAQWPMEAIESLTGWLGELVAGAMPEGPLRSLLVDGVIAGVGGVVVFLPQILILFLFIGALEDCGYMTRAAFLMDRLMSRVGLSGKSFIPLLSSFACAIPGIMGTRVIENSRDRLVTILVAPLMSCSARIPIYVLLAGTFVPTFYVLRTDWFRGIEILQPLVVVSMYFLGIITAALVALILKRTILRGPTPPFVLELPMYKVPSVRGVVWRSLERGWTFVKSAGSLILAISILVWAAAYFPHRDEVVDDLLPQRQSLQAQVQANEEDEQAHVALAKVENELQARWLADSYLGRAGKTIEPAVKPLGWDWRIGCAAIASFPAREVVVATLGVIFNLGGDVAEDSQPLHEALQSAKWPDGQPLFNLPVALSLMVFFALCAQCAATLVTIRRETNSWRWPLFTFVYMTGLAYVVALITYQVGAWLSGAST